MQSSGKRAVLTRRQFVAAGAVGGAAVAIGCKVNHQDGRDFLTTEQALTLGAITDQIVPADQFPSATQAGVLNYIDGQLVRHYRRHRDAYREGLERTDALSRELAALTAAQQQEIVATLERQEPAFFNLVRNHTMEGYYGSPRHGGNRDAQSWRMLGLAEPPLRGRAQYDLRKGSAS
jgi:gluconate 2-dehydrogenase gamma chain